MKYPIILLFILFSFSLRAQEDPAMKLKKYYLVILTKGHDRTQDSATVQRIQKAHLNNIDRLYKEGKIDIAGPFADDTDWRGVFVFNVASQEEAESLLKTDEAIASGRLAYIIHPWLAEKGSVLR